VQSDMRSVKFGLQGLTFDDVLLMPNYSNVIPKDVSTGTRITRSIELAIPIVSSPMDTVTEARLAIALAREGGIGVIHRNMSIEAQADEVDKVKRSESGMIVDPITLSPDEALTRALDVMEKYHISGVPITAKDGRLVGILTNRDIRFADDMSAPIGDLMTRENLITVPVGTTLEDARIVLHRHRIEKLPVVDANGRLRGLITVKDIQKKQRFPNATKDAQGRLRVAASVGVGKDCEDRVAALIDKEVDVIVVDVSRASRRISLGMKQVEPDPWATIEERYRPGSRMPGKVRNLTDFGAFVELEPGVDGLLHISDMSWTRNIGHPSEILKKGQEIDTQILSVDRENKRISLGLKQIQPDPWDSVASRYPMGSRVTGRVVRRTDFGAFVELEPGVDGLLHISQMSNRPIATPGEIVNVGDELTLMVIRVDPQERRIGLSLKELAHAIEPTRSEATDFRGRSPRRGKRKDDYDDDEE